MGDDPHLTPEGFALLCFVWGIVAGLGLGLFFNWIYRRG